ncbi:hypothetical protein SAMN05920897_10441 [Alkalispirochaeta americana]|uniref:Lipoprotein n=1 Tax=Alkalispirochaeta americana TaxID=159291 RepID=A0A1N6Q744_9SPIO|nr:hypothetical protein [Alkalispirochaeta americana]SIQ12453.1 hypothetical protein SAMN05920897_10441 [Alkalispirochaeta americana]
MKNKVCKSILAVMFTALAVVLVSCDDLVSSSSSSSSKANPGHLGESFTLPVGEIWGWPSEQSATIEARINIPGGMSFPITSRPEVTGDFPAMEITAPEDTDGMSVISAILDSDDFTWSDPEARIAFLEITVVGYQETLGEIYREYYDWEEDDDGNDIFEEIIDVEWWYVTADTSFRGTIEDDECEDEDECEDVIPLVVNLDLRQGWNRVVTRFYASDSREEATMTVGAEPAGVYWEYWEHDDDDDDDDEGNGDID